MSEHIPGPWYVSKHGSDRCSVFKDYGDERELIANAIDTWEEAEANAQLIAAAPELLEAAEELQLLLERANVAEWNTATIKLRAAIHKARGER